MESYSTIDRIKIIQELCKNWSKIKNVILFFVIFLNNKKLFFMVQNDVNLSPSVLPNIERPKRVEKRKKNIAIFANTGEVEFYVFFGKFIGIQPNRL